MNHTFWDNCLFQTNVTKYIIILFSFCHCITLHGFDTFGVPLFCRCCNMVLIQKMTPSYHVTKSNHNVEFGDLSKATKHTVKDDKVSRKGSEFLKGDQRNTGRRTETLQDMIYFLVFVVVALSAPDCMLSENSFRNLL